jgi:hypothetical protein
MLPLRRGGLKKSWLRYERLCVQLLKRWFFAHYRLS